jgi:hypothetical protein
MFFNKLLKPFFNAYVPSPAGEAKQATQTPSPAGEGRVRRIKEAKSLILIPPQGRRNQATKSFNALLLLGAGASIAFYASGAIKLRKQKPSPAGEGRVRRIKKEKALFNSPSS